MAQEKNQEKNQGLLNRYEPLLQAKTFSYTTLYEELNDKLGETSRSVVKSIRRRSDGQIFAVKRTTRDGYSVREAYIHQRMSRECPGVVRVEEVHEYVDEHDQSWICIIMEKMGSDLLSVILDRKMSRSPEYFTEQEVAQIMIAICKTVHFLHTNRIAHRDLVPENIMFSEGEQGFPLKLGDFSHAKEIEEYSDTLRTPTLNFNDYHAAPEVLSGIDGEQLMYKQEVDCWALGVNLYLLICFKPPFLCRARSAAVLGDNISDGMIDRIQSGSFDFEPLHLWKHISSDAIDLIKCLLKPDPSERLTMNQVMNHRWILGSRKLPKNRSFRISKNLKPVQSHIATSLRKGLAFARKQSKNQEAEKPQKPTPPSKAVKLDLKPVAENPLVKTREKRENKD